MNIDALRGSALSLLSKIGTPAAQTALVDFASQEGYSVADRMAAIDAFFVNAESNGILLTRKQIEKQYDRYNATENAGMESQQILGGILDWFEARMQDNDSSN